MLELQKVFDEIKIGFFLWFYKHNICHQRTRLHAATYDRVVLVFIYIAFCLSVWLGIRNLGQSVLCQEFSTQSSLICPTKINMLTEYLNTSSKLLT